MRARPAAGGSADCDSGRATRSCRCKRPFPSSSTTPQEDRGKTGPGERLELYSTATFRKRLSPKGPGHPASVSRGGHRTRISRAPWSKQSVDFAPMVQILDAHVALMVEQLPNLTQFFDTVSPDPEQVTKCPRSCLRTSLCARPCAFRCWRNSWWKCR